MKIASYIPILTISISSNFVRLSLQGDSSTFPRREKLTIRRANETSATQSAPRESNRLNDQTVWESGSKRDSTGVFRIPRPRSPKDKQPSSSQPNQAGLRLEPDAPPGFWLPHSRSASHYHPPPNQQGQTVSTSQSGPSSSQTTQSDEQYISPGMGRTGIPGGNVRVDRREEIYITDKSHFFLRTPENEIVPAILNMILVSKGVPSWLDLELPYRKVDSSDNVLIYNPGSSITFIRGTILVNLLHNNNPNSVGYMCFIMTDDNALFTADLVPLPVGKKLALPRRTAIYVRVPGNNFVHAGVLEHLAFDKAPAWLIRQIPKPEKHFTVEEGGKIFKFIYE